MRESKKAQKERIQEILDRLDRKYGTDCRCYLNHDNTWQLLVAVMLSAQCTDANVNKVTPALFKKYKSVQALADADQAELENDIRSIGLFRSKAKNIIACAKLLMEKYDGEVPSEIELLTELPGVGRKTANVIRGNIYNIPSIVVDTHVKRISNKLGLTKSDDPVRIEYELMDKLPEDHWILWNIDIITLGRTICIANREKCGECFLSDVCPSCKVAEKKQGSVKHPGMV